jgi:hypothetical protein
MLAATPLVRLAALVVLVLVAVASPVAAEPL